MNKRLFNGVAILAGMTIGVGMFGVPYAIAQVGFLPGVFYFLALGFINTLMNLAYGELVLRTDGDRQLPGYVGLYLGKGARFLAIGSVFMGMYGALLAYIIKSGDFLHVLMPQINPHAWSIIFFFFSSAFVFFGLKAIGGIESSFIAFLLVAAIAFVFFGIPKINLGNILRMPWQEGAGLNAVGMGKVFILPYGVLLYALSGADIVPEVEESLRDDHGQLKKTIFLGSLLPLVLYFVFALVTVGISGLGTSDDAIRGLLGYFPLWLVQIGALVALAAIWTSFLTSGYILRELYYRDLGVPKKIAWFLACFVPAGLYLAGFTDFIRVMSLAGAVGLGTSGALIMASLFVARERNHRHPEYFLKIPSWALVLTSVLFVIGALLEIVFMC